MAKPVERGMNRFYTLFGIVGVIGLGAIGYLAMRSGKPISVPVDAAILAADTAGFRGYILGSDSAPLEVTEYADYQCPGCQQFETLQFPQVRRQLIETGRVRWRYRDFPLDQIHPNARLAAHSAACANDQSKYWEQHRLIYEGQSEWSPEGNPVPIFERYAQQLGLNMAEYNSCMTDVKYGGRIQASHDEAIRMNVGVTPTFLIAGRLYPGGMNSDALKRLVDSLAPVSPTP
jgi:protein-disulfide isomerase